MDKCINLYCAFRYYCSKRNTDKQFTPHCQADNRKQKVRETMEITIDEFIKRFNDNANHERTHGNLQGCLEFRQLAQWLEKYQKIEQILDKWINEDSVAMSDYWMGKIKEVLEDGNE